MDYKLALATAGVVGLMAARSMAAPSAADLTFAREAAAGGMAEVSLGQLAQQNAGSQQVKDFGQRMVTDHSQANQELQKIAEQENLAVPAQPDSKDQAMQQRLSGLTGPAFDTAYTKDMVRDHQQDIAAFQREARSGQDPALKAFARKTLPVLRQHLQMAEAVAAPK